MVSGVPLTITILQRIGVRQSDGRKSKPNLGRLEHITWQTPFSGKRAGKHKQTCIKEI